MVPFIVGIGLALVAAVRGYQTIITLPEKMSDEKVNMLLALDAKVVRTPTEVAFDHPESHISVAKKLCSEIEGGIILDQYSNPANPRAHYIGTAEEIIRDGTSDGHQVDMVVIGAGTGGTVTGCAQRIHEKLPNVKIIGVDPIGSLLAGKEPGGCKSYLIEGIGYDFIPNVLDTHCLDGWEKTGDAESFLMARDLIRKEGLLCGGSSGSAMVGAIRAIKRHGFNQVGKRIVVILPDSVRNYMGKFLSEDWMLANNFLKPQNTKLGSVTNIKTRTLKTLVFAINDTDTSVKDVLPLMVNEKMVAIDSNRVILGVVHLQNIAKRLHGGDVQMSTQIGRLLTKDFIAVHEDYANASQLLRLYATGRLLVLVDKQGHAVNTGENDEIFTIDAASMLSSI
jgi:cystathionine beta-synthase